MVIKYLVQLKTEFIEEKVNLEVKKKEIKLKIDENARYIQELKEQAQNEFHAFSPRRNESLHENIRSSENDQIILLKEREDNERALSNVVSKLSNLNHIISTVKNDAREIDNTISMNQDLNKIIQKIEFCTGLVELDPMRCKIELSSLAQNLRNMIQDKY